MESAYCFAATWDAGRSGLGVREAKAGRAAHGAPGADDPGPHHASGRIEQLGCRIRAGGYIVEALDPGQFRMPTDRSGGTAGRIEQHAIGGRRWPVIPHVGKHQFGIEAKAIEILLQARHPIPVALHGRYMGACGNQLRRLSSGRCTEIDDVSACDVAQKPRRQGRGKILHPEFAFREPRQRSDIARVRKPHHSSGKLKRILLERGPRRITPFFIPGLIVNLASGQISIRYGLDRFSAPPDGSSTSSLSEYCCWLLQC